MPPQRSTSKAATELLGLSGNYLHMRQVPQQVSARVERHMGRNIAHNLKAMHHYNGKEIAAPAPPPPPTAEETAAFEELINSGCVADELSAAFEDEPSPFGNASSDSSATAFMGTMHGEGSFPNLSVAPHEVLYPWNLAVTSPPHVLTPAPAVQRAPPPVPASAPAPAATSAAPRPTTSTAVAAAAKPRSTITVSPVSAVRSARSPSESQSQSPAASSTPTHTSEQRGSRAPRGKRRIPLDAPIQPRTYHGPSRTSLRTLPRGFEKNLEPEKVAGFKRALEAVEDGEADDDDQDIIENVTNKVIQKRVKNTLAARKSRARRAEYLEQLERTLAEKDERVMELERELMEKDTEIRVLKGLMYKREDDDDEGDE